MKIWLDLANSPQVIFFRPILAELLKRGNVVEITTRAYAQTVQLTSKFGWSHTVVGHHGGRGFFELARQNYFRSLDLVHWAKSRHFDLAVSHNSYSQSVAAALLRIPFVTLMDYEHQPLNHLCFRLACRVIVPEVFPHKYLRWYGAVKKTETFSGVKEQVYLADFVPQPDFRKREGFPENLPLVVIRPPAPWTAYHRFENDLFDQLLAYLDSGTERYILFVPRLSSQSDSVKHLSNIHVATKVYDGPDLLYHSDLAISGGGTMNREAAVLGTQTYTVFKGKLGAVDRYLIEQGRMNQLQTTGDFAQIRVARSMDKLPPTVLRNDLVTQITDLILMIK